jgi:nucleotide-binding universal stress UspA family protein
VTHPTDFSELSMNAFVHALRISVAAKAKLYILHVGERKDEVAWGAFPHVRRTLADWGLFDEKEPPAQLYPRLGIEVVKVEIEPQDPMKGLLHFLAWHESDLMVLATHGREGLTRWLKPSIAEAMSRHVAIQNLFISPQSGGFVDRASGTLVPMDVHPPAAPALSAVQEFCRILTGDKPEFQAVHVGATPLEAATTSVPGSLIPLELKSGNVVEGVLQAAFAAARPNAFCATRAVRFSQSQPFANGWSDQREGHACGCASWLWSGPSSQAAFLPV